MTATDADPVIPVAVLPPAPRTAAQLTDGAAVALAASAAVAAWWHRPVPAVLVVAVVIGLALVRHPVALVLAVTVLASALAARSYAGLRPVSAGPTREVVTLVADPVPTAFGWKADVRLGRRRVELTASQGAGGALSRALAGERVRVEGRLSPPRPGSPWLVPRHVVGRITATSIDRVDGGSAPWRAANRFRRLLDGGSEVIDEPNRSLYGGFVLGDDRDQPPEIVDDFRGAGLTHLLVVSGQNVAFVLVLVSPVSARLGWRGRWLLTMAVIAAFGVVTRFEPSVLRASAMAAIAVTAGAVGRPSTSLRNLALAVTGLLLIDPLLVRSVGFQLSVGASLAIAVLAGRIAAVVPGPRALAEALGVTFAAQFGVAPVLVPLTGGLPVVSLIANPLAVPVAGLVTTWGLPAGVVAALGGPGVATVAHLPTELMITWVAAVAHTAASVPLGALGWPHLTALALAAVAGSRPPPVRWSAVVLVVLAVVTPAVGLRAPPEVQHPAAGTAVHRAGGATVVIVTGGARPVDLLESLRTSGVRRVDVLVVTGRGGADLERAIRHRWVVRRVIDPAVSGPLRLQVGRLVLAVAPPGPAEVTVVPP